MSPFEQCFMFLDNPRGGTDQMDKAKAAGYAGGFGNVIDYPPDAWAAHRTSAKINGMFFGPWGRTGHPPPQGTGFEIAKVEAILMTAMRWASPAILNCEKEVDNSGATITNQIRAAVSASAVDCALSTEAWPFGNVDWGPVAHLPVLPQIMPPDWGWQTRTKAEIMARAAGSKAEWHKRGVKCVYYTFGSFGGMTPGQYELQAPYSLYTADAIGIANYQLWKPTSTGFKGCIEVPTPPSGAGNTEQARNAMTNRAILWENAQPVPGPKPLTRITIAKEIVRLDGISKESWAKHAPAFRALIDQAEADE